MYTPFCGPELVELANPHSHVKGYNSMFRRCVYKKNGYELMIEYFDEFWKTYKDENKYYHM